MPAAAELFGAGRRFLLEWLPKGVAGAEIGVWKGDFTQKLIQSTRPRALHLIDPWKFVPRFPNRWYGGMEAKSQEDMDAIFAGVQSRFGSTATVSIVRKPSIDAAKSFPDASLDWVYIDGDHSFEAVLGDLRAWMPKLRRGGVLAGDDFQWRDEDGNFSVRRAAVQFADEKSLPIKFVVNGQFAFQL
ncbi:MAG TPA: class I SAM-dependent methyltransferase [Rhizomicrobium sp.]